LQFNSYSYLTLLFVAVTVFWALPVSVRRPYVLLLSVAFYASWSWIYAPLPFLMCFGVFLCAREIVRQPARAGPALLLGIAYILAFLAFFKYRVFLLDNLNRLFSLVGRSPVRASLALALPLGISFYSFEAISYLLDTRQGRVKSVNFMDLAMFVTFWPHLIAGPIVRVRELVPQLGFNRRFDTAMLVRGTDRLLWGLVQKNLIANNLASFVDEGFMGQATGINTTTDNWFFAVAFGLQIYFDFASYSNMAIGSAQLIGISLPENFNFPYHARNPADFWARWHMTLSRWIRDYLFFPINARFHGAPWPLYFSTVGIMALVGLWHGAGWGFVIWGVMHGLYLVLYRLWERVGERYFPKVTKSRVAAWGWQMFTVLAVMAAWIPFRASTLAQSTMMLRSLVVPRGLRPSYSINFYLVTLMVAAVAFIEPFLVDRMSRLEKRIPMPAQLFLLRPALYACGLVLFLIFDDRDTQFIYFQF
jgi:alginate O-acetyltransferase complex protein AlgI